MMEIPVSEFELLHEQIRRWRAHAGRMRDMVIERDRRIMHLLEALEAHADQPVDDHC